ncbi:hypothetical protein Avbf_07145 [Armadillidium vulgare]|nr:hypothetical protein Avbf_07145 [Armadillidium vulgare]
MYAWYHFYSGYVVVYCIKSKLMNNMTHVIEISIFLEICLDNSLLIFIISFKLQDIYIHLLIVAFSSPYEMFHLHVFKYDENVVKQILFLLQSMLLLI